MAKSYTVQWHGATESKECDSAEEAALWFASGYANPDNGCSQRMHLVVTAPRYNERFEFDVEAKATVEDTPVRGKETSQQERDGRRRSHHRARNNAISAVVTHQRKTPGHSRPGDEVECICGKSHFWWAGFEPRIERRKGEYILVHPGWKESLIRSQFEEVPAEGDKWTVFDL